MRIAIFGSKCDPPHQGHLVLAERARSLKQLDVVYFMPAGQPVDKASGVSPKERRFQMTEAAIIGNPAFKASRIEIDREGPSYSVDTVRAIRKLHGDDNEYFLIIGEDRAPTVKSWREPDELVKLVSLLIGPRDSKALDREALKGVLPAGTNFDILTGSIPGISSTFLRDEIKSGRSVRYLVPDPVLALIEAGGDYK